MSDSLITKKALAESIKRLMENIPLNKISVKEIVDSCGLNRQTFYYHFKDKFDLVNWIYYNEAIESIKDYDTPEKWHKAIFQILSCFMESKSFYINALNTPGQNSFCDYLFKVTHDIIRNVVNEITNNMIIVESDKKFITDFYTHAFVGITIQWVKEGMKESSDLISTRIIEIVDGSMYTAIKRFENN